MFFSHSFDKNSWLILQVPKPGLHPSTAKGIAFIKLFAQSSSEFETLARQITTILGHPPSNEKLPEIMVSTVSSKVVSWGLATPSSLGSLYPHLILELRENTEKSGISEVGFWVDKDKGGVPDSEFGKVVFVPI